MSRNLTYNEWLPYKRYEKHECDIKLKSGKIIKHVNPNAGFFIPSCGKTFHRLPPIPVDDVAEIMYVRYYQTGLCNGDCNAEENKISGQDEE